ncbi:MAG: hypothetical protein C5B47_01200 [Verrucomicrobia bacterium]|nr:MAG: hypothetical protein C5B47_01200 [Verrucomicrobiota bacterium]
MYRLPARLSAKETGWVLGFSKKEIAVLVAKKLLKPLGNPTPQGRKCFAAVDITRLGESPAWLDKATRTVSEYWWTRNHGEPVAANQKP